MTESLEVLGQSLPASGVLTAVYAVPSATSATVSSVIVCNQSDKESFFAVSVAVAGAADVEKQYIYGGKERYAWRRLGPRQSFTATVGLTLAALDEVRVISDTGRCSANVFGVEVT
jgi:hypothetical protein